MLSKRSKKINIILILLLYGELWLFCNLGCFVISFLLSFYRSFHLFDAARLLYKAECLIFTTLWANSINDKLMIFFLFFPENRIWQFMQIVSIAWNVDSCFLTKVRKISLICHMLKILPSVMPNILSVWHVTEITGSVLWTLSYSLLINN